LHFCVNDAEDMAAALVKLFHFPSSEVLLLTDERADADRIKEALRWLNEADLRALTQSGHGTLRADVDGDELDGVDEVFCPYGYDPKDRSSMLLDDDYASIFRNAKPGSVGFFDSDSCHSGDLLRSAVSAWVQIPLGRVRFLQPSPEEAERIRWARTLALHRRAIGSDLPPGMAMLSACRSDQTCIDGSPFGGRGNGAHTGALIEQMKANQEDTLRDWTASINAILGAHGYSQVAQLQCAEGALERLAVLP
jgi:hypothetical protein